MDFSNNIQPTHDLQPMHHRLFMAYVEGCLTYHKLISGYTFDLNEQAYWLQSILLFSSL